MGAVGAPGWTALLLLLLALLLRGRDCDCSGSSLHSLRFFSTAVSESGPGLPHFVSVGYVDGQLIRCYDSNTKRMEPRAPWMEKVTEDDPHYWDQQTGFLRVWGAISREILSTVQERYNHSRGLHTLQLICGCELSGDVPSGGQLQLGYEGRDFIAFNKESLTWTAAVPPALITKREWDADSAGSAYWRAYLDEECIDWLRKFLRYGKETLLRKEPPAVKVTQKDSQEGLETLLCQAHGFYPNEINITWKKDGEVRQADTFLGVVSPNSDGTYYTWVNIEIDPKDRSRYQCHVEHDGLQDPLDVAVEESVPAWIIVVGVILGVLVSLAVAGVLLYITSEQGSNSSVRCVISSRCLRREQRPPNSVML